MHPMHFEKYRVDCQSILKEETKPFMFAKEQEK